MKIKSKKQSEDKSINVSEGRIIRDIRGLFQRENNKRQ